MIPKIEMCLGQWWRGSDDWPILATKVVETPHVNVKNKKRLGVFHEIGSHLLDSGTFHTFVFFLVLKTYKTDPLVLD